jgi:hypothetical protein
MAGNCDRCDSCAVDFLDWHFLPMLDVDVGVLNPRVNIDLDSYVNMQNLISHKEETM